MDSLLHPPTATAFDAVSALLSASIYVLVALAAIARAPRDARTRVFLLVAAASIAPYCVTALIWRDGNGAAWSRSVIVAVGVSLMIGSLALLHFSQVFPWRRPWIRRHARWLWSGYVVVVALTAVGTALMPSFPPIDEGGFGAVSPDIAETAAIVILVVVVPLLFVLGIAAPFAGLMSLYQSWRTSRAQGIEAARRPTLWILISQMGGGVLSILIIPLLRVVAPTGPWVTIASALLFGCSLLMPIAFAAAVFRFGVLDLDIDSLPQ